MFADPTTDKIAAFLSEIGLMVRAGDVADDTFLPGIGIEHGTLVIDEDKLTYPGDLLHEGGHFAVADPARRRTMHGNVAHSVKDTAAGEEMAAIAWSYAAAIHLDIAPAVVLHAGGYRGGSGAILTAFEERGGFGVPLLQYFGMTFEPKFAAKRGVKPYPHMQSWLRGA